MYYITVSWDDDHRRFWQEDYSSYEAMRMAASEFANSIPNSLMQIRIVGCL